jgi:hypothetical protein
VIIPVAVFCLAVMAGYTYMLQEFDGLHAWLSVATTAILALAATVSAAGVPIGVCRPPRNSPLVGGFRHVIPHLERRFAT